MSSLFFFLLLLVIELGVFPSIFQMNGVREGNALKKCSCKLTMTHLFTITLFLTSAVLDS